MAFRDLKKLSDAMSGQSESKYGRLNRENRERNLKREAELRQSREAARIADKIGEKVGIRKDIRDAHTKLFRK